jgi:hypothetical protein
MRPNLPFVSAKHTLVTYNITLSLITKTNQGPRCFQRPRKRMQIRTTAVKQLFENKLHYFSQANIFHTAACGSLSWRVEANTLIIYEYFCRANTLDKKNRGSIILLPCLCLSPLESMSKSTQKL